MARGFLSRCLICWPTSTARDTEISSRESCPRAGGSTLQCTHGDALSPRSCLGAMTPKPCRMHPRHLTLTAPAKRLWELFHDNVEAQLGEGGGWRLFVALGIKRPNTPRAWPRSSRWWKILTPQPWEVEIQVRHCADRVLPRGKLRLCDVALGDPGTRRRRSHLA